MKPLSIEELKALEVGDWVWVEHIGDLKFYGAAYYKISAHQEDMICSTYTGFPFSNYGTKWLAYKNKEQAEAKDEIVNYETKYNALKTAVIDVCYSLDDKAYRNEFYNLRIGGRVQHIEKLADQAEAQFKESRGEK